MCMNVYDVYEMNFIARIPSQLGMEKSQQTVGHFFLEDVETKIPRVLWLGAIGAIGAIGLRP